MYNQIRWIFWYLVWDGTLVCNALCEITSVWPMPTHGYRYLFSNNLMWITRMISNNGKTLNIIYSYGTYSQFFNIDNTNKNKTMTSRVMYIRKHLAILKVLINILRMWKLWMKVKYYSDRTNFVKCQLHLSLLLALPLLLPLILLFMIVGQWVKYLSMFHHLNFW